MGVLGFAPFLQKQFPEVIRELPQRLRSLSGKTIAIDGTLITQRLHFAPMPCENRHILGWYRLMRELKECGVGVICVFDGKERSHAKQRETERRKKLHRMDVARGAMEVERSYRLRRLTTLLKHYRSLSGPLQDRATKTLELGMLTSHGEREIRTPLQEKTLKVDPEILFLTNQSLEQPISFIPQIESRVCIEPPNNFQNSTSSIPQSSSENVKIPASLGEPLTGRNCKFGLRTVNEALPEYFVAVDANKSDHTQEPLEASQTAKSAASDTSPEEDIETCPVDLHHLDSRDFEPAAKEPDNRTENVSQSTETQTAPPDGEVAGVCDNTRSSFVDPYASEETPKEDSAGLPEATDINTFTREAADSPPSLGIRDKLEPDGNLERVSSETGTNPEHVPLPGTEVVEVAPSPEDISKGLLALYHDFQQSIPTFMSPPIIDPPLRAPIISEEVSLQDEYAMSRNQAQLTLDEGNLWESLVRPPAGSFQDIESSVPDEKLESLAQKSEIISRSYEKRNNPPTPKTYDESKLILRAMGIPCIDTVGPYEAEALAASLVHNGLADYVASEDTDVLVYEAPLLRNLTNRQSPLTLWSGTEVREVLKLDRASYVDFVLLLGTDFSQRIKNLGPQRAIKLIRTHGRIEHVIANEPKYIPRVPPEIYLKQVEIARLVFETLPPVPDAESLRSMESDEDAVVAILENFGVYRAASVDWDFSSALNGNYFGDDPATA